MLLVMVVSFFDYEAYDMLIPAFSFQNYIDVFSEQVTWDTYLSTHQVLPARLGDHARAGLRDRLFPGVLRRAR